MKRIGKAALLAGAVVMSSVTAGQALFLDLTRDWLPVARNPWTGQYESLPLGQTLTIRSIENSGVTASVMASGDTLLSFVDNTTIPDISSALGSMCWGGRNFACIYMGMGIDSSDAQPDSAPGLLNGDETMLLYFSQPVSITQLYLFRYGQEQGQADLPQFSAGAGSSFTLPTGLEDTSIGNGFASVPVTGSWSDQLQLAQLNPLAPGYALLGVEFSLDQPAAEPPQPPEPGAVPVPAGGWLLASALGGLAVWRRRRRAA